MVSTTIFVKKMGEGAVLYLFQCRINIVMAPSMIHIERSWLTDIVVGQQAPFIATSDFKTVCEIKHRTNYIL